MLALRWIMWGSIDRIVIGGYVAYNLNSFCYYKNWETALWKMGLLHDKRHQLMTEHVPTNNRF